MHERDDERGRFLSLGRAAERLGVNRRRLREAIARGELVGYDDPLNRRCVLVRVEDLARLQPRPRAQPPLSAVA